LVEKGRRGEEENLARVTTKIFSNKQGRGNLCQIHWGDGKRQGGLGGSI